MFLESFKLPVGIEDRLLAARAAYNGGDFGYIDNPYPCGIFPQKGLSEIYFRPVTIFYGGNGSGKSTLLNLIAAKLRLKRVAPHNSGELFDSYVSHCRYTMGHDDEGDEYNVPNGSRIITSDDVFDYMLTMRTNNDEITEAKEEAREDYPELKYGGGFQMKSLDDYETLRLHNLARRRSVTKRQFIRQTAGCETNLQSNGETALMYFEKRLGNDRIYCLDEPENSMSPTMQLALVELLENTVHYCGCQLIIATHSPFILAMNGARVIDLDAAPAQERDWWKLDNVRAYYDFFKKYAALFEPE